MRDSSLTPATFGDYLRTLRRRVGLTQADLGAAVGYSGGQISMLEHNQRAPDVSVLAVFVHALGLEQDRAAQRNLLKLAEAAHSNRPRGKRPAPAGRTMHVEVTVEHQELGWLEDVPPISSAMIVRRSALDTLHTWLQHQPLLVIVGLPGMGKTMLAAELAHGWAAKQQPVFWLSLAQAANNSPEVLIRQIALFALSQARNPQVLQVALSAQQAQPVSSGHLLGLTAHVLGACKVPLLVIDDAHLLRTAPDALAVFQRLCTLAPATRVIFTSREQLPLAAPHMNLAGMSLQEADAMFAQLGCAAPDQALYERTAGNPLLLRLAAARQADQTTAAPLPDQADWIHREVLVTLNERTHTLLSLLAVWRGALDVGNPAVADELNDAFADYQHSPAIEELQRRKLIDDTAHAMPHALVRAPVIDQLRQTPRLWRVMHRVAANVALQQQDWIAALHHLNQAEEFEQVSVLLLRHGPEFAASGRGLQLIDAMDMLLGTRMAPAKRCNLHALRGDLLTRTDRSAEAERDYSIALEHAAESLERVQIADRLAANLNARGQFEASLEWVDAALAELGLGLTREGLRLRQQLLGTRIRAILSLSRWEEARKLCEQVLQTANLLALAEPTHVASVRALMNVGLGYIAHIQGRGSEVEQLVNKGIAQALSCNDHDVAISGYAVLSAECRMDGRMAESEQHGMRGLALARESGNLLQEARALHYLSAVSLYAARFDEGLERSLASHALSERLADREGLCASWFGRAALLCMRGDLAAAEQAILNALSERGNHHNAWLNGFALYQHAVIAALQGDPARAEILARETLGMHGYVADTRLVALSECLIGMTLLLQDRAGEAQVQAERFHPQRHDLSANINQQLLFGMLALHRNSRDVARAHAMRARDIAENAGFMLYVREADGLLALIATAVPANLRLWLFAMNCT